MGRLVGRLVDNLVESLPISPPHVLLLYLLLNLQVPHLLNLLENLPVSHQLLIDLQGDHRDNLLANPLYP